MSPEITSIVESVEFIRNRLSDGDYYNKKFFVRLDLN